MTDEEKAASYVDYRSFVPRSIDSRQRSDRRRRTLIGASIAALVAIVLSMVPR